MVRAARVGLAVAEVRSPALTERDVSDIGPATLAAKLHPASANPAIVLVEYARPDYAAEFIEESAASGIEG